MGPPQHEPIGLRLTRTAKVLSRAFDAALGEAGGSLPMWLILLSLKTGGHGAQRQIADAVGVEGPTLTHHLNRMEAAGLVTRTRNPANRRVQEVELTEAGNAAFLRLVGAAQAFDRRLRSGLDDDEIATLEELLARLLANLAAEPPE